MKYFEYRAARLPVVSTPLEFVRGNATGIDVAETPEAFAAAVAKQLARGRFGVSEVLPNIGDSTWAARMERMLLLVAQQGRQ